jgi:hypothetical protein
MGICPRANNKLILFNFLITNTYFSCYNYILVSNINIKFGGKSHYTCGIINSNKIPNLASKISSYIIR